MTAENQNPPQTGVEDTLRILANVQAPEGLQERVKARLRNTPASGRVLHWPSGSGGSWVHHKVVRAAAAAAIVFVVAGGGWGVYSRVQVAPQARVIAMPAPANPDTGFKSAGAMRTPQTVQGPVLAHPVVEMPTANNGVGKIALSKPRHGSAKRKTRSASAIPTRK